ncbi:MAG: ubiquinone/menaquinone biosynthesis methyltransferase, partial [Sedimentisphaerales bacterium]|nr:ubiquinone/menaquinone biosynthesis methyltransferase [Sedimentisphaerales bacterium]
MKETSGKSDFQPDFDAIAHGYDRANDLISLGMADLWRRVLVRSVLRGGFVNMLDLATGTGDIALSVASKTSAMQITALDSSGAMLEIARQRAERKGLSHISWVKGDMLALPFADNAFDCITVAFGLRNVSDRQQAIREIRRVLKPGGQVFILEFSMPRQFLLRFFFNIYFRWFMPLLGGITTGKMSAFTYLYQSVKSFYSPGQLSDLLTEYGLLNSVRS